MKCSSISRTALAVGAVAAAMVQLPAARADVFTNVPTSETSGFQLVYDLNIPTVANYSASSLPAYSVDNSGAVDPGSFGRVAYYMELDTGSGLQWVYASMDRTTPYANKTGVPHLGTLKQYQRPVSNVNVFSNVAGITTGNGRTGYNLEFWPTNYNATNGVNVNGAAGTAYDWGDERTAGNYGSMQLHDNANGKTLFAWNRWGGAAGATGAGDLGIGNNTVLPSGQTVVPSDWTFRNNAGDYTVKRLQVLVGGAAPAAPAVGTGAPAQVYANAPETQGMVHVHTLAVPQTGNMWNTRGVPYTVDNSVSIKPGSFDRIGYYMELTPTGGGATQYAYVSMDAFTTDPT